MGQESSRGIVAIKAGMQKVAAKKFTAKKTSKFKGGR